MAIGELVLGIVALYLLCVVIWNTAPIVLTALREIGILQEKGGVMTPTLVQQLADMVYRKSPMIADDLGLVLSEQDLDRLERAIVARWVKKELTEPFMPTIGRNA